MSKPSFVSQKIFNKNLVVIHKSKGVNQLNKPAQFSMCTLDLSKTLMYDFIYNYIQKKCDHKSKLLSTDTDSLRYETETLDMYEDFHKYDDKFHSGIYPENFISKQTKNNQ